MEGFASSFSIFTLLHKYWDVGVGLLYNDVWIIFPVISDLMFSIEGNNLN